MEMQSVRGSHKNLAAVGWEDGTLHVRFRDGRDGIFLEVPEEVKNKLLRSPYPDHLFVQIVRGKYRYRRVENATRDGEELPF